MGYCNAILLSFAIEEHRLKLIDDIYLWSQPLLDDRTLSSGIIVEQVFEQMPHLIL